MATGMIVKWNGEAVKTRRMTTSCGRFKPGDFLLFRGELVRVATVQTDCPHLENLHRKFIMVTLETRDGRKIPARSIGVREIMRKVR